jgi:hypothetical protein
MKWHRFKVQVVVLAIAVFGMTGPVAATQPVPFQGALTGSYTVTPATPPFLDVLLTITGNATQLGRFTAVFPSRVNVSTVPPSAVGTYTFTAANGDTLVADSFGQAMLVAPNVLYIVDNAKVRGGTGRFAGASGEFVIERLANQVTFTTIGSIKGMISSTGVNKR